MAVIPDLKPLAAAPPTETRSCPVCDAAGGPTLLTNGAWRLVRCDGCGLPYLPSYPSEQTIDTDFEWSESFARERYERWMRNPLARAWTMAVLFLKPSREGRAMRWIRKQAPAGRLMDVGCGDGRLLAAAQRAGYDVVGIESSPQMAAKARRRIASERIHVGRFFDIPLAPASFDVIVSVSYLEHEPQPGPALRRMHELLRPGGVCAHKTPNYNCWLRSLRGARWSGYRWPEHVQYFTPDLLQRLMSACGFQHRATKAPAVSDNFWIAASK